MFKLLVNNKKYEDIYKFIYKMKKKINYLQF